MKFAITTLCSLWLIDGMAQQVSTSLQFRDHQSQKPVPSVSVRIDKKTATTADSMGYVALQLPIGKHVIQATSSGYKTFEKTVVVNSITDSARYIIDMDAVVAELEEVVVISSTRTEQSIENNPLKVEVLSKEALNATGKPTAHPKHSHWEH